MTVTIYHNPRCSKSRQTLSLIEEKGIAPNIIEYLKEGPDAETLKHVLSKLGKTPRDILRKGEQPYKDLNLADETKSDDELIAAMVAHPILIERPIVIAGDKAALGRPPEQVLDIL
ncbi:MAG: arsenate reductase (glutaredoxin) [Alphaproteobacteria bacterium]|nr:arsenate reductase (glutaredoxin) [Rhodobiaceae bacterium]MBO6544404.1 arsenate reductase (glutaredoxin) [Alphaproteobacteria bacterium]MBO6628755.1 arsenate reductase (glutaredoxin) [Alphaproteobacteria bacterium]MDF1627363.1 arsenate reductase (glutaredoxin) [Parvibaculaceae bacterium]|tara:strand:+ start:238 stop:585 length:348 start_codon:yes stop_codon:yes gene_type:complete